MFESDFFERFSKVHPAVPFAFYLPVITALTVYGFAAGLTRFWPYVAFFALGWLIWDATEYAIHRFFFHWEGSGPFTRKLHDVVHGYHHQYPDDAKRLVMPLGASLPVAALVGVLLWAIGKPVATLPTFCGFVAAYMFYDFTHWSTHYRTPLTPWGRAIRSHHMAHHFANPGHNFGISHRWIDVLMGTLKRR